MDEPLLLRAEADGVVTLTLNRPAQFNALSEGLLAELQAALERVGADSTARVVVIAGAGKAFCAGHDLKEMRDAVTRSRGPSCGDATVEADAAATTSKPGFGIPLAGYPQPAGCGSSLGPNRRASANGRCSTPPLRGAPSAASGRNHDKTYMQALFRQCARVMTTIAALPQPVIARVHGIATAAGCQLVAACDLAVAADVARFAVSGINVGLFCSTPAVALSRNMGRKQALEMLLTGEFIDAMDAQRRGLVNRVVPVDALDAEVKRLAESICGKSALAIRLGKEMFYRQLEMGVDAAYQLAAENMACNMMSEDAASGIDAFLEKRKPEWRDR